MNAKVIVAIVVVLALLGVGGYMYMKKAPASSGQMMANTDQTPAPTTSTMQSLKDLLTGGASMKCTFSSDTGSTKSSGTVFAGNNKYKADIETTVDGKVSQMHMINDGEFSYIWGSSLPTGIKMKMDLSASEDNTSAGSNQYFDPNTKANYDCQPTTVSASSFVAPTDVKFMDLSTKMQAPPATTGY